MKPPPNPSPQIPTGTSVLAEMFSYWRRPQFTTRRDALDGRALAALLRLLAFSFFAVMLITPILCMLMSGVMGEIPGNALSDIDLKTMLVLGVVLAPLTEEVAFRSWMAGPRAAMIGLPIVAGVLAVSSASGTALEGFPQLLLAAVLSVMITQLGLRVWSADDTVRRAAIARWFPLVFWGTTAAFGLLHMSNYPEGMTHPILLLAVLPQTLVGGVLGYVRMRYGLVAAIGFHAAYNGVLIGLGYLLAKAAPEAVAAMLSP